MIRTYEIDIDDKLVEDSSKIFESLGSDIDSAIKIFLTQSVLRKGFPFDVALPDSKAEEIKKENMIESEAAQEISSKNAADGFKTEETQKIEKNPADFTASGTESKAVPENAEPEKSTEELNKLESEERAGKTDSLKDSENPENIGFQPEIPESVKIAELKKDLADLGEHGEAEKFDSEKSEEAQNSSGNTETEDEDETAPENLFAQWSSK